MPDSDALQPLTSSQKRRDILVAQIGRECCIDISIIHGHAVEKIHADATQQRIHNGLVDFSRTVGGGKRRDIFLRAGLDLRSEARCVQAERGLEPRMAQIKIARDRQRAPQFLDGLLRREVGAFVEPFRRHQFGAGADRGALTFDLDLDAHECLRRGIDRHGAEPERFCKRNRPFEK